MPYPLGSSIHWYSGLLPEVIRPADHLGRFSSGYFYGYVCCRVCGCWGMQSVTYRTDDSAIQKSLLVSIIGLGYFRQVIDRKVENMVR